MPSEPDNKMEELLKAYARKRRQDAGAPLELHPATRQLLQAEVKRLRQPAPQEAGSRWKMFALLWPRVAFASVLFAGLGVVTFAILRSQHFNRLAERERAITLAKRVETETAAQGARPEGLAPRGRGLAEKEAELAARAP